jgi:hypothetical protein
VFLQVDEHSSLAAFFVGDKLDSGHAPFLPLGELNLPLTLIPPTFSLNSDSNVQQCSVHIRSDGRASAKDADLKGRRPIRPVPRPPAGISNNTVQRPAQ